MKKLLAMLMVMAMIFSLAAVGTAYADDADDFHIDLTYSNVFNPAEWNYKAAELFAEAVTERTEGRLLRRLPGSRLQRRQLDRPGRALPVRRVCR